MPTKRLKVSYYAQNDNSLDLADGARGATQCNATSHTMLLNFLLPTFAANSKKNGFGEPEDYFKSKLQKYTDSRGDHTAFSTCLFKEFDIVSEWRTDLDHDDVLNSINAGVPIVLGMEYKTAGHIVLATGYDNSFLYINDPYGVRKGGTDFYSIVNPGFGSMNGKDDPYSWATLKYILFNGGGWGRIVHSVRGIKTGL